jgi:Spy/CpxP family protein refolding chaperone
MMLSDSVARSGARQHWWKVLLALSLTLNLFFIGGALWIRVHVPPPLSLEDRLDRMTAELGLDERQQQAFAHYSKAMRAVIRAMRQAVQPLIADAWLEVSKPHADEAKVMQLFDQAAQERRRYMHDLTSATLSFLATLSPEQRAKFVELARRRHRWTQPSGHDASH